jgi:predicted nicotinamide N-methyase
MTFVTANTSLRAVPYVPEMKLHLAQDAFELWQTAERELGASDQPPPFWAFPWPGGQALARYILDHPGLVAGRSVLDLGSGSGLTAIAAALAGASAVTASEIDPFALAAIGLNAAANGVRIGVTGDVLGVPGSGAARHVPIAGGATRQADAGDGDAAADAADDADLVLAADIWYERQLAARALDLLQRVRARGGDVLVGDVGRAFLPRPLLLELAAYQIPVSQELESATVKRVAVLTLRPQ